MRLTAPEFTLVTTDDLGWANVAVGGELDAATADDLQDVLRREALAGRSVLLDLSAVEFMDSSGLTAILCSLALARERDLGFSLRAPIPPSVARVADLCGVLDTLPLWVARPA